jgi:hypothetical protein
MGKTLQKLAVLGIAKIEPQMAVMCGCQVGTRHHRLRFSGFIGESRGALGVNNRCHRRFAVHLDDSEQFRTRTPHLEFARVLASNSVRQAQHKSRRRAVAPGHFRWTRKPQCLLAFEDLGAALRFHHQRLALGRP